MYLSGHDHTMQHLEIDGYQASFVVSGGGGAELMRIKNPDRGYAQDVFGFNHLHVTPEAVDVQYIDSQGPISTFLPPDAGRQGQCNDANVKPFSTAQVVPAPAGAVRD